ncbi:MAG: UDP-N-acetylmuramoyl-tripeptide--D-alanyl-D-alanine ligase, partial [Bacteroidetes bacterium]|nr:UDP-N-acetylmuramoyl-tripeptide--D-alanyl-D-alanine ligase [Bacteroidota bacterium]
MMIEDLYSIFLKHPSVCTDTRDIKPGSIFFALKGDNFNGNTFAEKAIELGSSFVVIDEEKYKKNENYFLVEDVLSTLQQLANYHRKQLNIPVIGITGSNGKTTTKELINAVLSKKFNVLATKGNLNNHIGVPLTLLSITSEHAIAIVEMGANHQGEIEQLCTIAEPDFGIITNIGKAHLDGFGGMEGVKKGKSELYKFIQVKKGRLFVHGDDEVLIELSANNEKVTYGTKKLYDIVGAVNESDSEFISFRWATRYTAANINKSELVNTQLVGIYNYYNLLCAACIGNYFKIEVALINKALAEYTPSNNRSQLQKTQNNILILDYYNANPSSMILAIENFAELNHPNKMLILGDMLELGVESAKEHTAIIDLIQQKKMKNALLVGPLFIEAGKSVDAKTFATSDDLVEFIKQYPIKENTILIKGSRGIKLEKVVQ